MEQNRIKIQQCITQISELALWSDHHKFIKNILMQPLKDSSSTSTFKVLLIGSSGVGKSSLLLKYVKNTFSYDYSVTTGVEYHSKVVKLNEKSSVKMQIWDTVGQEAFKSIVRSFYKGVSGILLIYSIERQESFEQLSSWMKEIQDNASKQVVIWLVGCKLDLQDIRKVPKKRAEMYSQSIGAAGITEVSSKTGQNVKQLFEKVARTLNKKYTSSQGFRQLVEPVLADQSPMKTQSFNLENRFMRRDQDKKQRCC